MRAISVLMLAVALALAAPGQVAAAERDDVLKVVTEAYIKGVHIDRDAAAMRRGFHPDFQMLMLADGKMSALSIEDWAARVERTAANPDAPKAPAIKYEYPHVDVAGHAAVVRVEIWRDGVHTFTDYLSLYRFPDGWKIVGKTYFTHPRQ